MKMKRYFCLFNFAAGVFFASLVFAETIEIPLSSGSGAAGGKGVGYLTVAAADTPAVLRNRADYKCDGTSATGGDEVEINSALAGSDTVVLCPGTFWVSGSINIASNKSLSGSGLATVIKMLNLYGSGNVMIRCDDRKNISITALRLDGNKANNKGIVHGVYFGRTMYSKIKNVWIENCDGDGICLSSSSNNVISGCMLRGNGRMGIAVFYASSSNIISNNILQNNNSGFSFAANSYPDTSRYAAIFLCQMIEAGNKANLVSNNICKGNNIGIETDGSSGNNISSNICEGNNMDGIYIYNSNTNIVNGNICSQNKQNGIRVSLDSRTNGLISNLCFANSQEQNGKYDDIFVSGSSYNNIQFNTCRAGTETNKPRYAIRIDDNTCQKNLVTNNDCYNGPQYGLSDVLADKGTGTTTATWTPNIIAAGQYEVFVWYVASSDRAKNAKYTITHQNGETPVIINQQEKGSQWVSLGSFNFTSGSTGKVVLTNLADGKVCADAVKFVSAATAAEIIVDNSESNYSMTEGWTLDNEGFGVGPAPDNKPISDKGAGTVTAPGNRITN